MKNIKYSDVLKQKYSTWAELEREIEKLPTTKAIGNAFEEFVYAYFIINSQRYQVSDIFMSGDIPTSIKEQYKIGNFQHQDSGVDGLILREDGKSFAYQCKFRTNRIKPSYEELTKFWADARYCDYACTVANSESITNLSDKHEQNVRILASDFDFLDDDFFQQLYNLVNNKTSKKREYFQPHDYQKKIISDVVNGLKIEDRGKVVAACGTGKTLTSLWIVESLDVNTVLFLAPSITLVKQTLEAWSKQAKIAFNYICICSDNTVSKSVSDDEFDISIGELGVPVTTDDEKIAQFLLEPGAKRKYVFSTYQSADKIANAISISKIGFDFAIFDEAHRTVGIRSQFSLALEDQFIRIKKRLFMTATERMVRPLLKRKAADNGEVIFSMDDESIYGPLLSRYNFGEAIKDKTISDYKIIVAGVKENEVYNYIVNNSVLALEDIEENDKISKAASLYAKIILSKVIREYPVKKVISFHSSIEKAKLFALEKGNEVSLRSVIKEFNEHICDDSLFIDNINCNIDSGKRSEILNRFKTQDYSILSNAKCLTEGVDVPIIDSVYFVDRKKSLVDIVQACGRALRTKKGIDKTAYFIVPILIPESSLAAEILYSEEFEIVYNIIQSLRDQDSRLEDWIRKLNKKYVKGVSVGSDDNTPPIEIDIEGVDIQDFSEQLFVQIATVNANPINTTERVLGKGDRKTGQARLFKTIGDYGLDSYMGNLVNPTIQLYRERNVNKLSGKDIKINHNNVSHTVKLGLIIKEDNWLYSLTPLGELYLKGKISAKELFARQLLRYSCSIEDSSLNRILFPYRACLEILSNIEDPKRINFIEFAFCIYSLFDSSKDSIELTIKDFSFLRNKYPNIEKVSIANREKILSELNEHFKTDFTDVDIWGSKTTTVKNQFIYFKNQLSVFDNIIEIKNYSIYLKSGAEKSISELLMKDSKIESLDRNHLIAKYTEAFIALLLFSI